MRKYPRTKHLEGSRLQPGDEDLEAVSFDSLRGRTLVVEEKMDGANAGLSFEPDGRLRLQSRGHFLTGGPREKHFQLFKSWTALHEDALRTVLGSRYIVFGEWVYAKHTVFYDALPHYFLEFDVLDTEAEEFLSTPRRRELLGELPLAPVSVLWQGRAEKLDELTRLMGTSLHKRPDWRTRLEHLVTELGLIPETCRLETDPTDLMEGLYIKVEENDRVIERVKYVRASFLTQVLDSGSHWLRRPIVPNQLADGVDIFRVCK